MPSQILVLTAIAIWQWLSVLLIQRIHPELNVALDFDPTTFLFGNLQIILILWVYQTVTKYIKF